jgi:SAM-dependent methyltransferase
MRRTNRNVPRPGRARHWDEAYAAHGDEGVSWYQGDAAVSLELIELLGIDRQRAVLDVGGGASRFAEQLVARGFGDLTVLDVSAEALAIAQRRAGEGLPITWLNEDLLTWQPVRRYDVWHDRAVLHFLVEAADRDSYVETLRSALTPGGAVVIGTFAPDGPDRCSGLPVVRYSADDLATLLGPAFELAAVRPELHATPGGVAQPFTWIAAREFSAR